ncbi:MAG: transcription-repair coupling factor [Alphaproteobacteria bacterium]
MNTAGTPEGMQAFILKDALRDHPFIVNLTASEQDAALRLQQMRFLCPDVACHVFPAWDCLPYDRLSPSLDVMAARMGVLEILAATPPKPFVLIMAASALIQYLPPRTSFVNKALTLTCTQTYQRDDLIDKFVSQGYVRGSNVQEAGEFAVRGSLIDVFPTGQELPIRIDFFGDTIEALRTFDPLTQRSLNDITEITLRPVKEVTLTPDTVSHFRKNYRELSGRTSDALYEAISGTRAILGMEHWLPLFFDVHESLIDYLPPTASFVLDQYAVQAIEAAQVQIRDYYLARSQDKDNHSRFMPLPPERLYWTPAQWQDFLNNKTTHTFSPLGTPANGQILTTIKPKQTLEENLAQVQSYQSQGLTVVLTCGSEGGRERIAHIFKQHGMTIDFAESWPLLASPIPQCIIFPLESGFITPTHVVVSEVNLFGDRLHRASRKRKSREQFLAEVATLNVDDIIVHRDHGVGRFKKLETITVDGIPHDCLLLIYDADDKLYLPVENSELISRYGSEGSLAALDRLGSTAWQLRKAKVKNRLREVAEYLIQLAAQRSLLEAPHLSELPGDYDAFCASFPYMETDDQQQAIEETLQDMAKSQPMDRLICGDVGFGKTEVALRAAFIAASNGKQVAVVVPTTLLCRQHYATFAERFRKTPYRVAQLSRLVKEREASLVRQDLSEGNISIIIATQSLLSDRIRIKDLGLMIIDEEHHFGVKQKEKLKSLKANVHVLTLSATPIPRTLQLALAGVRQLSLIRTPPVDRLAVRTFVGPFDPISIQEVILREQFRGGQIFMVVPRIEELAKVAEKIRKLVPNIRMGIAHGQLPINQLEDVMASFYDQQFDLLLATNIIESGIDIPSANTLIVYRADLFGLAQLYQLRGRVGRAKIQGYAYFTFVEEERCSPQSLKRLEVIQDLDGLGAGLQLANYDLELRGAGNIVGEEQSGHIREVGVELYHHLLEEAIMVVKAEQDHEALPDYEWTPQINVGLAVLIPEKYMPDLDLRLGLYRRLAAIDDTQQIEEFAAELVDRFGKFPPEVRNLLDLMEIKNMCRQAGIEKVDASAYAIVLTLRNNTFANPTGLLAYLQSLKQDVRIRPDQKIVFTGSWRQPTTRLQAVRQICLKLTQLRGTGESTR